MRDCLRRAETNSGTLIPPRTAAKHVITDAANAPDFYTVSRRELDGTLTPPTAVPIGRLMPFNSAKAADGGASLQTKRDHHHVASITHHHVVDGRLSLTVRWHDGTDGSANISDLRRDCKQMLDAYATSHALPQALINFAAKADRIQVQWNP